MFCKNCGKELRSGTDFCVYCGQKIDTTDGAAAQSTTEQTFTRHETAGSEYGRQVNTYPVSPGKSSANAPAILAVVLVLAACVGIGAYFVSQNQQERESELQAAQEQAALAQAAAEQAQAAVDAAQAEKEEAEAEAEAAQEEAEAAQKEAETARQEAEEAQTQTEQILAAIAAAQQGDAVTYDGYIFPSDREYITEADMKNWSQTLTLLARNEIFARHGYVFQTEYIQNYFASQSWYEPDPDYKGTGLSRVESANVDTIVAYETKKGWR